MTINLAAIGYEAGNEQEFFSILLRRLTIARDSLEIKRKMLETYTQKNLYPYTKFYLRRIEERFGRFWENHFSTIGIIGANEASLNLLGENIGTSQGKDFALKILTCIRDQLQRFQEQTGNHYNLEATPAEGTGYRLARLDKERYPGMTCNLYVDAENTTPLYTNSTQLPVNYSANIFTVLDMQDDLQCQYTGGTVQHIYLGEAEPDHEAVKQFVKMVCENYRLPYFTLSPSFSVCKQHGYLKGEVFVCPKCNAQTEVYSRVVGYLRPMQQWNEGKQAEFTKRSHYTVSVKS